MLWRLLERRRAGLWWGLQLLSHLRRLLLELQRHRLLLLFLVRALHLEGVQGYLQLGNGHLGAVG